MSRDNHGFESVGSIQARLFGDGPSWVQAAAAIYAAYHVSVHELARREAERRRQDATIQRLRDENQQLRTDNDAARAELARYTAAQVKGGAA